MMITKKKKNSRVLAADIAEDTTVDDDCVDKMNTSAPACEYQHLPKLLRLNMPF
jgi:hypothetical protein